MVLDIISICLLVCLLAVVLLLHRQVLKRFSVISKGSGASTQTF